MMAARDLGTSAAKRRRERHLRSLLRHERQTVAMELAAAVHNSRDGGHETHYGPREPKTASTARRYTVLLPGRRRSSCRWGAAHSSLRGGRRGWLSGTVALGMSSSWLSMPQCCRWSKRWTMSCLPRSHYRSRRSSGNPTSSETLFDGTRCAAHGLRVVVRCPSAAHEYEDYMFSRFAEQMNMYEFPEV